MFEAKPVSKKFWILKSNEKKVGEININQFGYEVKINGKPDVFSSMDILKKKYNIKFLDAVERTEDDDSIYGYPYSGEKYNMMWDLSTKLPLYTKNDDSKSWFAAGYYSVKIKNKWKTILAPKLIILQRNDYEGPFKTKPFDSKDSTEEITEDNMFNRWFDK